MDSSLDFQSSSFFAWRKQPSERASFKVSLTPFPSDGKKKEKENKRVYFPSNSCNSVAADAAIVLSYCCENTTKESKGFCPKVGSKKEGVCMFPSLSTVACGLLFTRWQWCICVRGQACREESPFTAKKKRPNLPNRKWQECAFCSDWCPENRRSPAALYMFVMSFLFWSAASALVCTRMWKVRLFNRNHPLSIADQRDHCTNLIPPHPPHSPPPST